MVAIATLAAVALFLSREKTIANTWGFPLDDSWIHAQIARNLAEGRGFVFNAGERVAGSTAPLYTMLLAILYRATHEVVWTSKVVGVLCHLGATVLVLLVVLRWNPKDRVQALLAGLLVGLSPPLLWAALSGMEISLYLLILCAGLYLYACERPFLAMLTWTVGVWVRPDGLFLVALGLILIRTDRWKSALAALGIVGGFCLFNLAIGGTVFPQTVGAKAHLGVEPIRRTWNLLREWGALWGIPHTNLDELEHPALLLVGLLVGAYALRRKRPLLALYAIGLPVALSLFRGTSGSGKRYILYVIPFGVVLAVHGFQVLSEKLLRSRAFWGLAVAGVVAIVWQGAYVARKATLYAWNVQNIDRMQGYLGRLSRRLTEPGDRIAANDIGAIGYMSERPIVDLLGLVTPPMPMPQALSRYKPELAIVFLDWFRRYLRFDRPTGMVYFLDADSTHQYALVAGVQLDHNTIAAHDQMFVFKRFPRGAPPPADRLLRRF